jgi:hypothetical protein
MEVHSAAMKTRKGAIAIERLDERRYAVTVDASCVLLEPRRNANSALPCWVKRRIGRTKTKH